MRVEVWDVEKTVWNIEKPYMSKRPICRKDLVYRKDLYVENTVWNVENPLVEKTLYVEKTPIYVEKTLYVEKTPIYVEKTLYVENTPIYVEKTLYVENTPIYVEKILYIEKGHKDNIKTWWFSCWILLQLIRMKITKFKNGIF